MIYRVRRARRVEADRGTIGSGIVKGDAEIEVLGGRHKRQRGADVAVHLAGIDARSGPGPEGGTPERELSSIHIDPLFFANTRHHHSLGIIHYSLQ